MSTKLKEATHRICSKCHKKKDVRDFWTYITGSPASTCRKCKNMLNKKDYRKNKVRYGIKKREYRLEREYGISTKIYETMLLNQNETCAICKSRVENRTLDIDHCHKTGVVRGLLCRKCNLAIGFLDDRIDLFISAVEYLQKFKDKQ